MKPIRILYVSRLCSEKVVDFLYRNSGIMPLQSAQKFHRLIVEGLVMYPELCQVETLSLAPIIPQTHKKKIWKISPEILENARYNYIPILNFPILREVIVFVYTFFKVLSWGLLNRKKNNAVVCDALILSISIATILACKITGVKVTGIVTDLPNLMVTNKKTENSRRYKLYKKLGILMITSFDKYILLTEQMNEVINPLNKPYIVMEGLVDAKMNRLNNSLQRKEVNRILIYAGAIHEKYGIKNLMEAFMKLEGDNLSLHIYGTGDMEELMPYYMNQDKRMVYKGVVLNENVVECQLKATLLINPRPTTEEFTKFSFPSKNIEYMVSGTPLVTTKLPGMPLEYNDYVYLFEDESVHGIANTLGTLLLKSDEELINFGKRAKQFVLEYKSNTIQTKRILDLLKRYRN